MFQQTVGVRRKARRLTSGFAALCAVLLVMAAPAAAARLDRSFGENGFAGATPEGGSRPAYALAEDPNGRLVVGSGYGERFLVSRHLPNGSLDTTFGLDGTAYVPLRRTDENLAEDVRVMPNGRVVVVGSSGHPNNPTATLAMFRLGEAGRFDRTFANDGWAISTSVNGGRSLAFGRGGRIAVSGFIPISFRHQAGALQRFTSNGDRDFSFVGGPSTRSGQRSVIHIPPPRGSRVVNLGDARFVGRGKIVAVGDIDEKALVVRLNANGTYDRSFGRRGRVTVPLASKDGGDAAITGMTRDRRGRILIVGTAGSYDSGFFITLVRLHADGRRDRSFGSRGVVRTRVRLDEVAVSRHWAFGNAVAVQRDGRIVVAGEADVQAALVRYDPDGSLDKTFFDQGVFHRFLLGRESYFRDLLIDRRGRIVAAGGSPSASGHVLVRIWPGRRR